MANPRGTPENLKSWKPGQSGNPGGKPKGASITSRLRELLDQKAGTTIKVRTRRDEIAKGILEEALARDHKFVETLLDRTEGKVPAAQPESDLSLLDADLDEAIEPPGEADPGTPDLPG